MNWLDIHFLNVDHGDCTIIRHPNDHRKNGQGRISFVDINDFQHLKSNAEGEMVAGLSQYLEFSLSGTRSNFIDPEEYASRYLDDPIEYYLDEYSGLRKKIWRFIPTHPDMDHLSGLKRLDDEVGFSVMWDTEHNKEQNLGEEWPDRFAKEDWIRYKQIRKGDTSHSEINPYRGYEKKYWKHDNIKILHPSKSYIDDLNDANEDVENPEYNNASYVLKISHGNQAILLPGDAEEDAWETILDRWPSSVLEDVTILKAAHHGVKSGFHPEAVELMDPDHIVLSTGKKKDTDAHHLYRKTCSDDTKIWSTRQYGTMKFRVMDRRAEPLPSVPDGIFNLPEKTGAWA